MNNIFITKVKDGYIGYSVRPDNSVGGQDKIIKGDPIFVAERGVSLLMKIGIECGMEELTVKDAEELCSAFYDKSDNDECEIIA